MGVRDQRRSFGKQIERQNTVSEKEVSTYLSRLSASCRLDVMTGGGGVPCVLDWGKVMLTGNEFCEGTDARDESAVPSAPASRTYVKPKRRRRRGRRGAVGRLCAEWYPVRSRASKQAAPLFTCLHRPKLHLCDADPEVSLAQLQ